MMEELTGVPVVGVVPALRDVHIPEEDSMSLAQKERRPRRGKVNVAVVPLQHISNFTDFDALEFDGRFHVYYTDEAEGLEAADVVVLPGTKNTIGDLEYLQRRGTAELVREAYRRGKRVVGICGGYQMLGLRVEDPLHVEGSRESVEGIGLLPVVTVMGREKVVCQSDFLFRGNAAWGCRGYQIHMGETRMEGDGAAEPLNVLADGGTEGCWRDERCWGTYMHGILDNRAVLDELAGGQGGGLSPERTYAEYKEQQYDLLAERVREALDMEYIYRTLKE